MGGHVYPDGQCFLHQACQSMKNGAGISGAIISEIKYVFKYLKFI
jgi:hypothetical protein